ncbi:MAG: HD domain-containing protein [Proteobacteria bacterium]|nr:HD domain-containing protein [Pseudomonadota bacterium]
MDKDDFASFQRWFSGYVGGYYTEDPAHDQTIRLKQEHTDQVCKEIVMLGQALNLPSQDMLLAETMALFHDLGRFEQYATYGTFEDARSENHAALGLRELVKHDVLSVCSDEEQRLITKAIGYHNVRVLPENELERTLFFARLLRDADKLDIWRVFIDYYDGRYEETNSTIVLGLPNDSACSPKIVNALRLERMADTRDMATLNDYKLLQISWVFDVNFEPTFRAVCERRYVEKITATLPQTREIREVVSAVLDYLKKRKTKFLETD